MIERWASDQFQIICQVENLANESAGSVEKQLVGKKFTISNQTGVYIWFLLQKWVIRHINLGYV